MRATLILVVMTGCCVLLARSVTAVCSGSFTPPRDGCGCAGSCPDPTCEPQYVSGYEPILADARAKLIALVTVDLDNCLGISADISLAVTAYVDCILQCNGILDNCKAQLNTALTATLKIDVGQLVSDLENPGQLPALLLDCLDQLLSDVQVSANVYTKFNIYINELCVCKVLEEV